MGLRFVRFGSLPQITLSDALREDARGSGSSDDGGMPSYEDVCNSERDFDSTLNAPGEIEQVSWMPCPSLDDQKRKGCFVMCAKRNNCFCRILGDEVKCSNTLFLFPCCIIIHSACCSQPRGLSHTEMIDALKRHRIRQRHCRTVE